MALCRFLPQQPADALRDVPAYLSRDVLVPDRHCRVRPAHDAHHRSLRHAEDQQHRGEEGGSRPEMRRREGRFALNPGVPSGSPVTSERAASAGSPSWQKPRSS